MSFTRLKNDPRKKSWREGVNGDYQSVKLETRKNRHKIVVMINPMTHLDCHVWSYIGYKFDGFD